MLGDTPELAHGSELVLANFFSLQLEYTSQDKEAKKNKVMKNFLVCLYFHPPRLLDYIRNKSSWIIEAPGPFMQVTIQLFTA